MMKTLDEYMALPYKIEITEDSTEGGFVVSYPELPGCLTCGETIEQALQNAKEAKREWIAAAMKSKISIAEPNDLEGFSGQFNLRIPKSLHKQLSDNAKSEGVSMNQYCVYLLSQNNALQVKA